MRNAFWSALIFSFFAYGRNTDRKARSEVFLQCPGRRNRISERRFRFLKKAGVRHAMNRRSHRTVGPDPFGGFGNIPDIPGTRKDYAARLPPKTFPQRDGCLVLGRLKFGLSPDTGRTLIKIGGNQPPIFIFITKSYTHRY